MLNKNVANQTSEVTELDLVFINDKEVMTDSLTVAIFFGKSHFHVMRDIRRILKDTKDIINAPTFGLVDFIDKKGEKRNKYIFNKDATVLLIMGYTGKEAMKFKLDYINAFNAMYDRLKLQKTIDEELAEAVKLDEISFMSASEAAKVLKKRQVDKPIYKDNIQRILNKKQRMFDFMHDNKQIAH